MKIEGDYDRDDWFTEVRIDGKKLSPARSLKVFNHSPDGFAWGYSGSGPAQLALAILLEAGLSNEEACYLHHGFKNAFISSLKRDSFSITVDVMAWVERNRLNRPSKEVDHAEN